MVELALVLLRQAVRVAEEEGALALDPQVSYLLQTLEALLLVVLHLPALNCLALLLLLRRTPSSLLPL